MQKGIIMLGMAVGSTVGAYFPMLWGGSLLSITSVVLSAIGGILGILGAWKLTQSF